MYYLVGSCVLQSILSLKVSNYLNQGTVSQRMDPKWPMEIVKCGYFFSVPERCCPARVVSISAQCFGKSLLRCGDFHLRRGLANTQSRPRSEREGEL